MGLLQIDKKSSSKTPYGICVRRNEQRSPCNEHGEKLVESNHSVVGFHCHSQSPPNVVRSVSKSADPMLPSLFKSPRHDATQGSVSTGAVVHRGVRFEIRRLGPCILQMRNFRRRRLRLKFSVRATQYGIAIGFNGDDQTGLNHPCGHRVAKHTQEQLPCQRPIRLNA